MPAAQDHASTSEEESSAEESQPDAEVIDSQVLGHRRGAAEVMVEVVSNLETDEQGESSNMGDIERGDSTGKFWTTSMKTLGLTAALFATITIAQVFAAKAANSQALLMDCISMGVDAGTYVCNMFVERKRGSPRHTVYELVVGFISLATLVYFTNDALMESLDTIKLYGSGGQSDEPEVNAWIILAFALFGLLFDAIALFFFRRSHKKSNTGKQLNMFTAFLHVGADFLRSTTTLVMSLLILCLDFDGAVADAWASLIVGISILLGALTGIVGWVRKFHFWCVTPVAKGNKEVAMK